MMRSMLKHTLLWVSITTFTLGSASAEGVDIHGYLQAVGINSRDLSKDNAKSKTCLEVQEVDLFLQRKITTSVSALVNLQLTNNFSQDRSWGSFNMDEAWVKFSPYRELNIRIGKIVPMFNTFNQVKTKYPLIPYILRPVIYETMLAGILDVGGWIPDHAFLQVNGIIPVSKIKLEYALFGGNSEFTVNKKNPNLPTGYDTTNKKSVGGRLGVKGYGATLGVSGSYDQTRHDFLYNTTLSNFPASLNIPKLGAVPRSRIGCDFNYTGYGITADFEYIYSQYHFDDEDKATLNRIIQITTAVMGGKQLLGNDFTRTFINVNLMYDFLEKYFVSVGFASLRDKSSMLVFKDGLNQVMGGLGYRLNDHVTFKGQVINMYNDVPAGGVEVNTLYLIGGVSVYF